MKEGGVEEKQAGREKGEEKVREEGKENTGRQEEVEKEVAGR